MSNQDMGSMPVRELIIAIREKTRSTDMDVLTALVLNTLTNRLEQEANKTENLAELLQQSISMPDNMRIREIEAFHQRCRKAIAEATK